MYDYDKTLQLIILAQGGSDDAKEELITENTPLIKSVIRRYRLKGVEYDDLFQLGCLGFIKAISNFDMKYNVKFSTYAVPMIAGEVKRFLRDDGIIKVSRSIKQKSIQIKKYIVEEKKKNINPTIEELSKKFGLESQEIIFIMESAYMPISINDKYSDDENSNTFEEKFADDFSLENEIDKMMIKDIISSLNVREKKIIIMRYYMDKTQSEIAKHLGVSQVQVSRIENKILSYFKKQIN